MLHHFDIASIVKGGILLIASAFCAFKEPDVLMIYNWQGIELGLSILAKSVSIVCAVAGVYFTYKASKKKK